MMEETNLFFPISALNSIIGDSKQANYLHRYLTEGDLKTKGFVIESDYVDKDFLIDYANFYSRSFKNINRFTTRLHFFNDTFSNDEIKKIICNEDPTAKKRLIDAYLGYVVKKPIFDSEQRPLIGKTILKTYKDKTEGEPRTFLKHPHSASFFGIPLNINSLPFQVQDKAVGACATTACWVALHPLSALFGIEKQSPFEVTELSVSFPFPERNFPSEGLSTFQMKYYFTSIGIETEFVNPTKIPTTNKFYDRDKDDIVTDIVKAYINFGLPIIALLNLWKDRGGPVNQHAKPDDYHAAVISGYRFDKWKIVELYVHDDRIGPYHKVIPDGNFLIWNNDLRRQGFSKIAIDKFLIPIYPKIRLKFSFIYQAYLEVKRSWEIKGNDKNIFNTELLLFESKKYKEFLIDKSFRHVSYSDGDEIIKEKFSFLTNSLPRYLWVIRQKINENLFQDGIFDATIIYPEASLIEYYYKE